MNNSINQTKLNGACVFGTEYHNRLMAVKIRRKGVKNVYEQTSSSFPVKYFSKETIFIYQIQNVYHFFLYRTAHIEKEGSAVM